MARKTTTSPVTVTSLTDSTRNVNKQSIDEWGRFKELIEKQQSTRHGDKGVQIFLASDLKLKLEQMKANGLNTPIRYILNAALQSWLENNKEQVNKYLYDNNKID